MSGRAGRAMQVVGLALLGCALGVPAAAEDWPRYRGPLGNGFSPETGWRKSGELKIVWRTEVGMGYASVVVAGGRAYATGHDGSGMDSLYCLDAETGKEIWRYTYPQPLGALYFSGGTTGTPAVSNDRVFQVAREGEVFCLDAKTKELRWKMHLVNDLGFEKPDWGFTGNARIRGDVLLLTAGEGGVALRVEDGKPVWKSGRGAAGYSGPVLFRREQTDYLVVADKRGYVCVDPDSGKEHWRYKWLTRYGVNASDPIVQGDEIFLSTGYGKGAALLRWAGAGEPETLWKSRDMCNQMNPCVYLGGYLYGIDGNEGQDRTGLKCLEMASGKVRWLREEVGHGSVIAGDGHLIVLTEQGDLQVAPISPEGFHPSRSGRILEGKCWTQPSLSGGRLYARNQKGSLVCVDLRG